MSVSIIVNGRIGFLTMDTLPLFKERNQMPEVRIAQLSELKQDENNANAGSERGQEMIEDSFRSYGAGRSLVLDKNGTILCGNHSAVAAASIGMDEVVIVPSDGTKIVAVQRMDLDANDPKAKELAMADNRTTQVGLTWDSEVLKKFREDENIDTDKFFTPMEFEFFTGEEISEEESLWQEEEEEKKEEVEDQNQPKNQGIMLLTVYCETPEELEDLASRLESEGYKVKTD